MKISGLDLKAQEFIPVLFGSDRNVIAVRDAAYGGVESRYGGHEK